MIARYDLRHRRRDGRDCVRGRRVDEAAGCTVDRLLIEELPVYFDGGFCYLRIEKRDRIKTDSWDIGIAETNLREKLWKKHLAETQHE